MAFGILGVGHLARSIIIRLLDSGVKPGDLVLSARGQGSQVGAKYGIPVMASNAELVRRCKVVLLSVRPRDAVTALASLPWSEGHVVVSACAGIAIARLQEAAPAARITRVMPLTACELGASPTTIFPDLTAARPLIDPLGPVIVLRDEQEFETATVSAATYGWAQDLIRQSAQWLARQGVEPATARQLMARTFVAAGRMADEAEGDLDEILRQLVTPGGITELGLKTLARREVPSAWAEASDAVLARLRER
ncbi:pyrroline-5-carboxylate reductase family protein [Taklimakanibacter lacteus]|uniref:pyrroline-5-carboxylate reductase family protein n=1 Tax=Taklimakanibacter lacteus TaxID=2268456 RepID=UPI000E66564C